MKVKFVYIHAPDITKTLTNLGWAKLFTIEHLTTLEIESDRLVDCLAVFESDNRIKQMNVWK